ncbi:Fructose-bisphosphate aldolase [compost metagenome]
MRQVCQDRFVQFGSAGHADKIKALSTATMAKRYSAGELNAKFGAAAKKAAAE